MGVPIMSKILVALRSSRPDESAAGPEGVSPIDEKKDPSATGVNAVGANSQDGSQDQEAQDSQDELHPDKNLQDGVKKFEAVTLTWSKASLIAVFVKSVPLPPWTSSSRETSN